MIDHLREQSAVADPPGIGMFGQPLSDAAMQELWLRRVQTKPADFLRAKFSFQLANEKESEGTP